MPSNAPRYSRPVPASRLPALGRPWWTRAADELRAAARRERQDGMLRIGFAMTSLAVLFTVLVTARG